MGRGICVCVGSPPSPPELAVGVNVGAIGCLLLVMDWQPVQGVSQCLLVDSWDRLHPELNDG